MLFLTPERAPKAGPATCLLLFLFLMVTVAERPVNKNTTVLLLAPPVASYGKATSIHTNMTFLLCSAVIKSTAGSPKGGQPSVFFN